MAPPTQRHLLPAFCVSRAFILLSLTNPNDVRLYYGHTQEASEATPLRQEPVFEYPPLAYLYIILPTCIGLGTDFGTYHKVFRTQSYIIDLATFVLRLRMPGFNAHVAWGHIVGSSFLGFLLYDRLDVVLAFPLFVLLRQRGHKYLPYACLGIGTAFKVLPLLVLPALFLCDWHRNRKCALSGVAVFGLAAGGPVVLALIVIGSPALSFVSYHAQRGKQIESTWAVLAVLATPICGDPIVYHAYGGRNLHSQFEASLANIFSILCILISIGSPLLLSAVTH